MSVPPHLRECSWMDSSESNHAEEDDTTQNNGLGIFPTPQARPRAKKGHILKVDTEEMEIDRSFW